MTLVSPERRSFPTTNRPRLSIVPTPTPVTRATIFICTYNRVAVLAETLAALVDQQLDFAFDVVVVDDGSSDGTEAFLATWLSSLPPHIRGRAIRHEKSRGVGASRAEALVGVESPYLVSIDDDCITESGWLSNLMEAWDAASPSVMGIGGFVRAHHRDTLNRRYLDAREPHRPLEVDFIAPRNFLHRLILAARPPHRDGVRPVHSLVGGNLSFRRTGVDAVGGYDPNIRFGGPETRVGNALRARFGDDCLMALPESVVRHEFEPDLASTFRRAYRAGHAAGRDWAWQGAFPSIRPAPLFVLGMSALSALLVLFWLGPLAALIAGLIVALVSGGWAWGRTLQGRFPEFLIYPLIAASEEMVHNGAVLTGRWAHRGTSPSIHQ